MMTAESPIFDPPIKGDIDRALSNLMHECRHKLIEEQARIVTNAAAHGSLQSNRVVMLAIAEADKIHVAAMKEAAPLLRAFIERMDLEATVVTGWALPHMENLSNSVLGVIKPNGFPGDLQRAVAQYRAVFKQRVDGLLRDVEIGFVRGAGFVARSKMTEEWIDASAALRLVDKKGGITAMRAICKRAKAGLVKARAVRFIQAGQTVDNVDVPAGFWWAEGEAALNQDWDRGDFDTWIQNGSIHLEAFGVTFRRADIVPLIPAPPAEHVFLSVPTKAAGGRPKASWSDDLWIEMCRQLYGGHLIPKTQADIAKAMTDWLAANNFDAGDTTIKERARKLWAVISKVEN